MEWTVVTVIGALLALGAAIIKPLLALNGAILSLTIEVKNINKHYEVFTERNKKAHDILFDTQREHDKSLHEQEETLEDHEKRITKIESEIQK